MIYIIQLIFLVQGEEKVFEQFEEVAIPIISEYNGRMLFRVRPDENSYISCEGERPYEIHLAEFDTEQDFKNFSQDEERKKFLHLKERSIKASVLIMGTKL